MQPSERCRVRHSFQRGAMEYDHHTPVQQRVVQQLLERIAVPSERPPGAMLDIGCGTGRLLAGLMARFPAAEPVGLDLAFSMLRQAGQRTGERALLVQAEAEHLPFADNRFALIASSSTYQWCDSLVTCFSEAHRCLQQDGRFTFALFGNSTFQELRDAWKSAWKSCGLESGREGDGTHRFHSVEQVRFALETAQFRDIVVESTVEQEWYPDVAHLLQSVKRIGAGSSRPAAGRGLGWRRVLHAMAEYYTDRHGTQLGVPASYQVIWGQGVRRLPSHD